MMEEKPLVSKQRNLRGISWESKMVPGTQNAMDKIMWVPLQWWPLSFSYSPDPVWLSCCEVNRTISNLPVSFSTKLCFVSTKQSSFKFVHFLDIVHWQCEMMWIVSRKFEVQSKSGNLRCTANYFRFVRCKWQVHVLTPRVKCQQFLHTSSTYLYHYQ